MKLGQSRSEHDQKKVFGLSQIAIFAFAIFECLKSDRFVCTRHHFPKRVRFVTAFAIYDQRPQPGMAEMNCSVWQNCADLFFNSGINLGGAGF